MLSHGHLLALPQFPLSIGVETQPKRCKPSCLQEERKCGCVSLQGVMKCGGSQPHVPLIHLSSKGLAGNSLLQKLEMGDEEKGGSFISLAAPKKGLVGPRG